MRTILEFAAWLAIMSVVVGVATSIQESRKMGVSYVDFWRHWSAEVRYHIGSKR